MSGRRRLLALAAAAAAAASDAAPPPRHREQATAARTRFLMTSLLQVRGGESSSYFARDFDWREAGAASPDPLLDSIFGADPPIRRKAAGAATTARPSKAKVGGSSLQGRPEPSRKGATSNERKAKARAGADRKSNAHAVWGPDALYRKQSNKKPPGPPPGSPPPRATADERRSLQRHRNMHNERKALLSDLSMTLHDSHVAAIHALIKGGSVHVPPALFGQTIVQERSGCNERYESEGTKCLDGKSLDDLELELGSGYDPREERNPLVDPAGPAFRHIEDQALLSYWGLTPNAKLYGGAQYHRALRYYHHLFLTSPLPPITGDEVALLTNGISEVHDASDLMRAVALLVRHKMERVVEDVLADMTKRLLYVMDRQWEMVDYSMTLHRPMGGANGLGKAGDRATREAELYRKHGSRYTDAEAELKGVLSEAYRRFAEERAADAHAKCLEDARSLLRYVTWDMGRARDPARNRGQNEQGFVSQIEIVGESAARIDHRTTKEARGKRTKNTKPGHTSRMIARGGGAVGFGRRRTRDGISARGRGHVEDWQDNHGNGTMKQDRPDGEHDAVSSKRSLVVSSTSSPLFSGDDEVLNELLDTLSSTLVPKSDTQAGHTQAAIIRLASYVGDKMRLYLSRMVRAKFNTFFLLSFYEDLGPYLRRELDEYLSRQLDG